MKQKKRGKSQFTYKARWLSFHKPRKHNNEFLAHAYHARTLQGFCTLCFHNLHTRGLFHRNSTKKKLGDKTKNVGDFPKNVGDFPKNVGHFLKNVRHFREKLRVFLSPSHIPKKHCNLPQLPLLLTRLLFHPNLPLLRGLFAHFS